MSRRLAAARLWLLAFTGFMLLHAGWAFAAPYDGPPDEQEHALRAAAVVRGEFVAGPDRIQTVPRSLDRGVCFPMRPDVAADCEAAPGGDETPTQAFLFAARYNPLYYALTGWPLGPWPNWTGILLSRLLTGAAMAALLACAVVAAARWTRHQALVAGVVVAATPMVAHLGGSINPNGLEIAAAVALFTALIALVHEQRVGVNRAAVALAAVSAAVLVTPRFTGLLWLAVIALVLLVPSSRARLRTLARAPAVRAWSVVVALAVVASAAWTLLANPAEVPNSANALAPENVRLAEVQQHTGAAAFAENGWTVPEIARFGLTDVWPNIANQMVGVMGWAETLMPRLVYVAWFMAVGLVLLGGLVVGTRVDRWRLLALFVGTFTPLMLAEVLLVNQSGWFNQGRYFLPGAVGLPLLGAFVLAHRALSAEQVRTMTRLLTVLLVPIHLVCLAYTMTRWQSGLRSLNPLVGSWLPPSGPVLPLVCAGLAVAALFVTYWLASRIHTRPPGIRHGEAATDSPADRPVTVT